MILSIASPSFVKLTHLVQQLVQMGFDVRSNPSEFELEPKALTEFLQGAHIAVIGKEQVDLNLLSSCPELRLIAKYGVGMDQIDQKACQDFGVQISSKQGVNAKYVAEHVLGQLLSVIRHISKSDRDLKQGIWKKDGGTSLFGKTVGIIGAGFVGKALIDLIKPFECQILINDILDMSDYCALHQIEQVSKSEIFRRADVISLHLPLTPETRYLISKEALGDMRDDVVLVNAARGRIVDLDALYQALLEGKIGGAALDVFEEEPLTEHPILRLDTCVVSPHMAANSREATQAMGMAVLDSIRDYMR